MISLRKCQNNKLIIPDIHLYLNQFHQITTLILHQIILHQINCLLTLLIKPNCRRIQIQTLSFWTNITNACMRSSKSWQKEWNCFIRLDLSKNENMMQSKNNLQMLWARSFLKWNKSKKTQMNKWEKLLRSRFCCLLLPFCNLSWWS